MVKIIKSPGLITRLEDLAIEMMYFNLFQIGPKEGYGILLGEKIDKRVKSYATIEAIQFLQRVDNNKRSVKIHDSNLLEKAIKEFKEKAIGDYHNHPSDPNSSEWDRDDMRKNKNWIYIIASKNGEEKPNGKPILIANLYNFHNNRLRRTNFKI